MPPPLWSGSRRRALATLALLSLAILQSSPASSQPVAAEPRIDERIDALLDRPEFENAFWGIQVTDLETGSILYARNEKKSLVPASNAKLYTTAAALDQLGPDFRYRTVVWTDGVVDGTSLKGNLIVRGSGDPTIGGRFDSTETALFDIRPTDRERLGLFRAWADSLRMLGITHIHGDIVGDDDTFDDLRLGSGWQWDDELFYYAAEIGALVFNENTVDFEVRSQRAGMPAEVTWEPFETDFVQVDNATLTLPSDSRLEREGYERLHGTNHFQIRSRLPEGRDDTEALSIVNPTLYFVHTLRETLLRAGIAVSGRPQDVDDLSIVPDYAGGNVRPLFSHTSPPLQEIVRVINKESNNLYAQQVLRTLGARLDSSGIGSADAGSRVAAATFASARIDTSRLILVDGSGLARQNFVTPEMTVGLLTYMWFHPNRAVSNAFYQSLPIAGVDGTLESRFASGGPAVDNARAKTGFVGHVRNLSGYVRTTSGKPLAFSLMCNNYTIETRYVNAVQDAIVTILADLP